MLDLRRRQFLTLLGGAAAAWPLAARAQQRERMRLIGIIQARNNGEIEAAFASFAHDRPDALFVSGGPLFTSRRVQLVLLATRHGIPIAFPVPEHVRAGGLMSYSASRAEGYHQVGIYAGRILKGASPAELPVVQSTKFERASICKQLRFSTLSATDAARPRRRGDRVM